MRLHLSWRSLTLLALAFGCLSAPNQARAQWTTVVADPGTGVGETGFQSSMARINGNPAIAYVNSTTGGIMYVRATDANGTAWGTPISIYFDGAMPSLSVVNGNPAVSFLREDLFEPGFVRATDVDGTAWGSSPLIGSFNDAGYHSSLEVVNGFPAFSYYDTTIDDLMFVRATNANGTNWAIQISVDSAGMVGRYTSLRIVNGFPAISYYDQTNGDLKYVRALDASGASWGTPVVVDGGGGDNVGLYTSLRIINGVPAISYHDATNLDLRFVAASDVDGAAWGTPVTVDGTGAVGLRPTLMTVGANPGISYYDATNGDLKFVAATDAAGASWGAPITVDAPFNVGDDASLAIINGNPAISYLQGTARDLRYVRATNASGSAWGAPLTVDDGGVGDVGKYSSLMMVNGRPAISYYEPSFGPLYSNGALRYVRAADAIGSAWGAALTLDNSLVDTGLHSSMAIVNGNPAIAYHDYAGGAVKFIRASDADGSAWGSPATPDTAGFVGEYCSLAVVSGNPAIAYYDDTNRRMKYVRATDANGTAWGAPVVADNTIGVGLYTSLNVVGGVPAISYFDDSSFALRFARGSTSTGSGWLPGQVIDSASFVGHYTSLKIVAGNPAIAYRDFGSGDLRYVRCTTSSGMNWGSPIALDASLNSGVSASLEVIDGYPAIAYHEAGGGDLRIIEASNSTGSAWSASVIVDGGGTVGQFCSLRQIGTYTGISYYDATNRQLKYAYRSQTTPTPLPSCPTLLTPLHQFDNPAASWDARFGHAVALSGNRAVVGAPRNDIAGVDEGQAFVFDAGAGVLGATLAKPAPKNDDHFGSAVAVSGDSVLVGAPDDDPGGVSGAGRAFLFHALSGDLLTTFTHPGAAADDQFGFAVAIEGDLIAVGAPNFDQGSVNTGRVFLFDAATGAPGPILDSPQLGALDSFGSAIAMDPTRIIIGAPNADSGAVASAGEAYIYNATTFARITLVNPQPSATDDFGDAVSISGGFAIVGAPGDNADGFTRSGRAYVFNAANGQLISTLKNPTPGASEAFGQAVALKETFAIVGAPFSLPFTAGEVHVFDVYRATSFPPLVSPSPPGSNYFGISVAVSGDLMLAGERRGNLGPIPSGRAILYGCPPPNAVDLWARYD